MGVLDYYDHHPINERHVLAAAGRRQGGRERALTADDLFPFDQDHYGGLAAVDILARRAGITAHSRVLDLCAGLGGPARFLASRRGCRVVAVELNAGRAQGAARLTRQVGLAGLVRVVRADAAELPFRPGGFDACISQEALLHVPDKLAVLSSCHRALAAGARLAFTDWIAHPRLGDHERGRLSDWMAATTLQSLDGYRALLGRAGFGAVESEDLSDEWRPLLRARLALLRALRPEGVERLGETRWEEYDRLHVFFVRLVEDGKLGGGRFTASR
jgi:sarcosine/dimethylglycine N-methyltransferase